MVRIATKVRWEVSKSVDGRIVLFVEDLGEAAWSYSMGMGRKKAIRLAWTLLKAAL